jgi:hypothetical protein
MLASFAGTIAEPSLLIDLVTPSTTACLQLLSVLIPCQRGFDPIVKLHKRGLPEPVRNAFERYHQATWYGGAKFKRGGTPLAFEGSLRIKVQDKKQNRTDISPPKYQPASLAPFGRATRRCLACPSDIKLTMCFLKDSWHKASLRFAKPISTGR